MATYTADRRKEIPDQTPVELPLGYKAPETLEQLMARMIRNAEFNRIREAAGAETFEEADDFEVGDEENDGLSQYQLSQMQEEHPIVRSESTVVTDGANNQDTDSAVDQAESGKSAKAGKSAKKTKPSAKSAESVDDGQIEA